MDGAGDVIYTNMPTRGPDAPVPNVQYFWEAFPSGSGQTDRTTYMFTYIDADPSRCGLTLKSLPCSWSYIIGSCKEMFAFQLQLDS